MFHTHDYVPKENLEEVDGCFTVDGGSDSSAFFNVNLGKRDGPREDQGMNVELGGFSTGFARRPASDVVVVPTPAVKMAEPKCNGVCEACAFSFLCGKVVSSLTGTSGPVPKIG